MKITYVNLSSIELLYQLFQQRQLRCDVEVRNNHKYLIILIDRNSRFMKLTDRHNMKIEWLETTWIVSDEVERSLFELVLQLQMWFILFLIIIDTFKKFSCKIILWFYQDLERDKLFISSRRDSKRMTLKNRTMIDEWNSHIDILFNFDVSRSDKKDDHSDCMILSCKQDSQAVMIESNILIQNDKTLYSKCSHKDAARDK